MMVCLYNYTKKGKKKSAQTVLILDLSWLHNKMKLLRKKLKGFFKSFCIGSIDNNA